jgi:hypothetical protein
MTGAVKLSLFVPNLKTDLPSLLDKSCKEQANSIGMKSNGQKVMKLCYMLCSIIVHHFLQIAHTQFLEKQKRVFHSVFVSVCIMECVQVRFLIEQ